MKKDRRDIILLKFIDGEALIADQRAEIQAWIEASQANREHFEFLQRLSSEKKYSEQLEKIDANAHLQRFREEHTVGSTQSPVSSRQSPVSSRQSPVSSRQSPVGSGQSEKRIFKLQPVVWLAAASVAVLLAIAAIFILPGRGGITEQQLIANQTLEKITLDDGTVVELNLGATLTFPKNFRGDKRNVTLRGEAFFNVAKDPEATFSIKLSNTTVEVLGTSFNIRETRDGRAEVRVETGTVKFFDHAVQGDTVILKKGDMATYNPESRMIEKAQFQSQNYLFWKTSRLTFVEAPLKKVFDDLGRAYMATFIVRDTLLLNKKYTSECIDQSLEEILNEMQILYRLDYTISGDTVTIMQKPDA